MTRRWRLAALVLLFTIAVIEGLSAVFVRVLLPWRARHLVYAPPVAEVVARHGEYLAHRDPDLGWPSRRAYGAECCDESGARRNPAFPIVGTACVSAYGDSFTWGDEVPPADAWVTRLAERLGCRVANYGANGYGTDQAFLRWRLTTGDEARLVIFTIYPENVVRNVNRYRPLLTGEGESLGLKPRFVLEPDGTLRLVPIPTPSADELRALLLAPERFLTGEYFTPDGPAGPIRPRVPHLLGVARLLRNEQVWGWVRALRTGEPTWAAFYEREHPSGSFAMLEAIVAALAREVPARGQSLMVQILPTPAVVATYRRTGTWVYDELLRALAARGVEVVNLGADMLARLGDRSLCELLVRPDSCTGHFDADGNRLIAEIVAEQLARRGLRPERRNPPPAARPRPGWP